jgi:hypothetical protein
MFGKNKGTNLIIVWGYVHCVLIGHYMALYTASPAQKASAQNLHRAFRYYRPALLL